MLESFRMSLPDTEYGTFNGWASGVSQIVRSRVF